jgi:tetratricopeptide (TPR) repeat protein
VPADELFRFDLARHRAATELRPEHIGDFQRLVKTLRYGSRFQLLFAEFTEADYRDMLIRQLDLVFAELGQPVARIDLSHQGFAGFAALEAELRRLAADHGAIHLTGVDGWFDEGRWRDFNIRREAIAFGVPVRLAIWLGAGSVARAIVLAPDLWAWRGGVYAFTTVPAGPHEIPQPQTGPIDPRTLAERSCRIAVLRDAVAADPPPDDEILGLLLDELAGLLASIGELDEALRIRQEEELPVYERLGDVRERAVTLGKIADVYQARGQLDEALRIRQEEELPVYERLGDVRERAVTLGKIADVYQARGQLDEALRIRQEEQLPVYERLGDVQARAVTLGKIADVHAGSRAVGRGAADPPGGTTAGLRTPRRRAGAGGDAGARSPTCIRRAGSTTRRCASARRNNCRSTNASATCGRGR